MEQRNMRVLKNKLTVRTDLPLRIGVSETAYVSGRTSRLSELLRKARSSTASENGESIPKGEIPRKSSSSKYFNLASPPKKNSGIESKEDEKKALVRSPSSVTMKSRKNKEGNIPMQTLYRTSSRTSNSIFTKEEEKSIRLAATPVLPKEPRKDGSGSTLPFERGSSFTRVVLKKVSKHATSHPIKDVSMENMYPETDMGTENVEYVNPAHDVNSPFFGMFVHSQKRAEETSRSAIDED